MGEMLDFGLDERGPKPIIDKVLAPLKRASATYAHMWTVRNDKVARFRQYIDTLAIAKARES